MLPGIPAVEQAERIAEALGNAESSAELAALEGELNVCIEAADGSSRQLEDVKAAAGAKLKEADGVQAELAAASEAAVRPAMPTHRQPHTCHGVTLNDRLILAGGDGGGAR